MRTWSSSARGAGPRASRRSRSRRSTSADRGVSVSTPKAPNKVVHDRPCLLRRGDPQDEFLVGGPQRQVEERAAGSLLSHDRLQFVSRLSRVSEVQDRVAGALLDIDQRRPSDLRDSSQPLTVFGGRKRTRNRGQGPSNHLTVVTVLWCRSGYAPTNGWLAVRRGLPNSPSGIALLIHPTSWTRKDLRGGSDSESRTGRSPRGQVGKSTRRKELLLRAAWIGSAPPVAKAT
jgi:hypothetical protein